MKVNIENFQIEVIEYHEELMENGSLYITDSMVSEDQFSNFIEFYNKIKQEEAYFSTELFGKSFYGRFGQLAYSKEGKCYSLRLTFVESTLDDKERQPRTLSEMVITDSLEYRNLFESVAKQEIISNKLKSFFIKKGVFKEGEIEEIFTVNDEDLKNMKFKMKAESKNLKEYLVDIVDTMEDIKNEKR